MLLVLEVKIGNTNAQLNIVEDTFLYKVQDIESRMCFREIENAFNLTVLWLWV